MVENRFCNIEGILFWREEKKDLREMVEKKLVRVCKR